MNPLVCVVVLFLSFSRTTKFLLRDTHTHTHTLGSQDLEEGAFGGCPCILSHVTSLYFLLLLPSFFCLLLFGVGARAGLCHGRAECEGSSAGDLPGLRGQLEYAPKDPPIICPVFN